MCIRCPDSPLLDTVVNWKWVLWEFACYSLRTRLRPEQIATNRSSLIYIGRNFLNVLCFEEICITRSLDLCYLIRSYHTLRTCSGLGTSVRVNQWQLPKLGESQWNKSVQEDREGSAENSTMKDGSGIYQFHRESVSPQGNTVDRSCLKAVVPSSSSTEKFAILHVDFGGRTLMAMLHSLNHGSDE